MPSCWVHAITVSLPTGPKEEEDGKSLLRDKDDKAITCLCCRNLH